MGHETKPVERPSVVARLALGAHTKTMMMMIIIIVQAVPGFSFDPSRVGTFASWVVALTGKCKTLLSCASDSRRD